MLSFRKITEENFIPILRMDAGDDRAFVPPNAEWLAQAWLYYEAHDVFTFAIYDGETPVGLMQLEENGEEDILYLWRVMIDRTHQGRGLGSAAAALAVRLARESGKYPRMGLGCKPENRAGMHIYEKLGFRPTGEVDHGEVQMVLTF